MTRIAMLCLVLALSLPVFAHADGGEPKGLSWFEISAYSPKYHAPDGAWLARLAKTSHLKIKLLRKNANFEVKFGAAKYKDGWKTVADACAAALGAH